MPGQLPAPLEPFGRLPAPVRAIVALLGMALGVLLIWWGLSGIATEQGEDLPVPASTTTSAAVTPG